jgi:hypothetical protein
MSMSTLASGKVITHAELKREIQHIVSKYEEVSLNGLTIIFRGVGNGQIVNALCSTDTTSRVVPNSKDQIWSHKGKNLIKGEPDYYKYTTLRDERAIDAARSVPKKVLINQYSEDEEEKEEDDGERDDVDEEDEDEEDEDEDEEDKDDGFCGISRNMPRWSDEQMEEMRVLNAAASASYGLKTSEYLQGVKVQQAQADELALVRQRAIASVQQASRPSELVASLKRSLAEAEDIESKRSRK